MSYYSSLLESCCFLARGKRISFKCQMPHAQTYPPIGQAISKLISRRQSIFPWQVRAFVIVVKTNMMLPHLSTPLRTMKDRLPNLRLFSHFLRCLLRIADLKLLDICATPFANTNSTNWPMPSPAWPPELSPRRQSALGA